MNFERSPFFSPRWARNERKDTSVSLETLTVYRTSSSASAMSDSYAYKRLSTHTITGSPRRVDPEIARRAIRRGRDARRPQNTTPVMFGISEDFTPRIARSSSGFHQVSGAE